MKHQTWGGTGNLGSENAAVPHSQREGGSTRPQTKHRDHCILVAGVWKYTSSCNDDDWDWLVVAPGQFHLLLLVAEGEGEGGSSEASRPRRISSDDAQSHLIDKGKRFS